MVPHKQVKAWVRQAEADLNASKAETASLAECHRRYLIQQSYEKAIKALALMLWESATSEETTQFDRLFLGQHSPLKTLAEAADSLYRPLYLLNRQLKTFLMGLDNGALLLKIDATKPMKKDDKVSYRYPFVDEESGSYTAPVDFDGWDNYQGERRDALKCVTQLLGAVGDQLKLYARKPK